MFVLTSSLSLSHSLSSSLLFISLFSSSSPLHFIVLFFLFILESLSLFILQLALYLTLSPSASPALLLSSLLSSPSLLLPVYSSHLISTPFSLLPLSVTRIWPYHASAVLTTAAIIRRPHPSRLARSLAFLALDRYVWRLFLRPVVHNRRFLVVVFLPPRSPFLTRTFSIAPSTFRLLSILSARVVG